MRIVPSITFLLAPVLFPLPAAALGKPWETPLSDSIHAYIAKGALPAADSLVRLHASEMLAKNGTGHYAKGVLLLITGNLDSVLSLAHYGYLEIRPSTSQDDDLALILEYEEQETKRKIDSVFGDTESAAALKLLHLSMLELTHEKRKDSASDYDPDWYFTWKMSPLQKKRNDRILNHLSTYGESRCGRDLSENFYFDLRKYRGPGAHTLEGGGWMDGRDAGPIWWRSTSFVFDYRLANGFAFLKLGRAVSGVGVGHRLLETHHFLLSPYAGVGWYPAVHLGEYANTRRYAGPDLGLNLDWKLRMWRTYGSQFNLYLRTNAGTVVDPNNFSADFPSTSFVYLNFGVGINLDIIAKYTPYAHHGKIKFKRDLSWR